MKFFKRKPDPPPDPLKELHEALEASIDTANELLEHRDDPDFVERAKNKMLPAMRRVNEKLPEVRERLYGQD